jgi:hypothetical protein
MRQLPLHLVRKGQEQEVSPPFFEYFLDIFPGFEMMFSRSRSARFLRFGSDTSDTVFVVNGGRWRSWKATDPKLIKRLKRV